MITSDLFPYVGVAVGDTVLASSLTMGFRHPTVLSGLTLAQSTETTAVSPDPASLTFEAVYPAGWPLPRVGQLCQLSAATVKDAGALGIGRDQRVDGFGGFVDSVEVTAEIPAGPLAGTNEMPVPLTGWTLLDSAGNSVPLTVSGDRITGMITTQSDGQFTASGVTFYSPEMDLSALPYWTGPGGATGVYVGALLAVGGPGDYLSTRVRGVALEGRPAGTPVTTAPTVSIRLDADYFVRPGSMSIEDPAVTSFEGHNSVSVWSDLSGPLTPFASDWAELKRNAALVYRLRVLKAAPDLASNDGALTPAPAILASPRLAYMDPTGMTAAPARGNGPGRMVLSGAGRRPAMTRVKITATDTSGWAARARVGGTPITWNLPYNFIRDLNDQLGDQFTFGSPLFSTGGARLGPVDVDSQSPWDIEQKVCASLGTVAYPDPNVYGAVNDTFPANAVDLSDPAKKPRVPLYGKTDNGRNTLPLLALWDKAAKRLVSGPADESVAARIPASQVMLGYRSEDNSGITNQLSVSIRRYAPDETIGATEETLTYENTDSQRQWGPSSLSIDTLLFLNPGDTDAALDARMQALVSAQSEPQARLSVPITLVKRDAPFPDAIAQYLGQAAIGRALTVDGAPEWFGESRLVTSTKATLGVQASLELETEPAGYNGATGITFDQLSGVRGVDGDTTPYTPNFAGCQLTANDLRGIGPSLIN